MRDDLDGSTIIERYIIKSFVWWGNYTAIKRLDNYSVTNPWSKCLGAYITTYKWFFCSVI